jgi:hypothetical protein
MRRTGGILWAFVGFVCLVWAVVIPVRMANFSYDWRGHAGNEFGDGLVYLLGMILDLFIGVACLRMGRRALTVGAQVPRGDAYKSLALGLTFLIPFFVGEIWPMTTTCGAGLVVAGALAIGFTSSHKNGGDQERTETEGPTFG